MSGAPGGPSLAGGVLLLDSIGELASVYEFADLAFIGGSLVPKGGHNVLEPAYFGVPILVGPHTENFRDIVDIFRRADALRVVTPETLAPVMLDLLVNWEERERLGRNARDVMHSQQGATRRDGRGAARVCCPMHSLARSTLPRRSIALESLVSGVRRRGTRAQRVLRSRYISVHRLQGPVVSIGNLSTGGAGKTPFLILLGELLKQRSVLFDVLSRGYRRETKGVALVDPAGTARQFGDEPLLIARKLGVPVVVGEDRYAAGVYAEQNFGPQLHLLDDGFQHRRLARDFDIVMLTPTDVRDSLLPAGRLREPLSSLARADAVVLSGNLPPESVPEFVKRRWRVQRSIFAPPIKDACVAFCGIARPEPFFSQLQQAGMNIVATQRFRDHHAYDADEMWRSCFACATGTARRLSSRRRRMR